MKEPITKNRLQRYISLRLECEKICNQIEKLKINESFPAAKPGDGSQRTGTTGDRMANAIINRLEYEETMAPILERNKAEMLEINKAINALDDPNERVVLRMRYTEGDSCRHKPWEDIAMAIYGDNDERCLKATYRLHGRALKNIQRLTCR